jgi:hypothetical protein
MDAPFLTPLEFLFIWIFLPSLIPIGPVVSDINVNDYRQWWTQSDDNNSESDFFFPPLKSEYFFQQHWESEYFFRKKP